jgi:hypothetical protein
MEKDVTPLFQGTNMKSGLDFGKMQSKDGDYWIVGIQSTRNEDRGGSGKISNVVVSVQKGGEGALSETYDGNFHWHTTRNAAFISKDGAIYRTLEVPGNQKITITMGRGDKKKHAIRTGTFLVIKIFFNKTGEVSKRTVRAVETHDEAMHALLAGVTNQYAQTDVFEIKNYEAVLLGSTASVQGATDARTTGFSCFDRGYNPYTGCSHGCVYCYGCVSKDFSCLPLDLKGRVVIGTHIDPYQPCEEKALATQTILRHLVGGKDVTKVGIFTKSPLVVRDLDLISKLPNPSIHMALSPFDEEMRKRLEQNAPPNEQRIAAIREIYRQRKIKLVVNVCPCMPDISSMAIEHGTFAEAYGLADEICVGLTCLYGDIPKKLAERVGSEIVTKMTTAWEVPFLAQCRKVFAPYAEKKLVIWRDTGRRGWKNMWDMSLLPQEFYAS